ncbi:hypothetical protein [Streptomyces sp. NPDC058657]|uniref:hypothetical protein n=1 Tax=unclassified Streptomyces TaxID=2593676 RepID=UPI003666E3ED
MATDPYGPDDVDEQTLDDLDRMTDDELAAYFEDDTDDPEVLLLAGCGRPATRTPRPVDVYRAVDELPGIETYRPTTEVHHA